MNRNAHELQYFILSIYYTICVVRTGTHHSEGHDSNSITDYSWLSSGIYGFMCTYIYKCIPQGGGLYYRSTSHDDDFPADSSIYIYIIYT